MIEEEKDMNKNSLNSSFSVIQDNVISSKKSTPSSHDPSIVNKNQNVIPAQDYTNVQSRGSLSKPPSSGKGIILF